MFKIDHHVYKPRMYSGSGSDQFESGVGVLSTGDRHEVIG